MRTRIGDIASVFTGYTARTALAAMHEGEALALHAGAFPAGLEFGADDVRESRVAAVRERAILVPADVVFSGRGDIRASVFRGGSDTVLALAPLLVVRLHDDRVCPAFVALQLTSGPVADALRCRMQGTASRFVGRGELVAADIGVPDRPTQQRLVELHRLHQQETTLMERLAGARARLLAGIVRKAGDHG